MFQIKRSNVFSMSSLTFLSSPFLFLCVFSPFPFSFSLLLFFFFHYNYFLASRFLFRRKRDSVVNAQDSDSRLRSEAERLDLADGRFDDSSLEVVAGYAVD